MGSSSEYNTKKEVLNSDDNVWSSILTEVRSNASVKLPSGKSIVVLGDNESGKTTLVAKLQGIEDPKKGCGLEYAYIEIRDEYRDDSTHLGVWVLDGNSSHSNLLKFALNEVSCSDTLIMLTVSMSTPWLIIDQLQNWAAVLHDHIDSLNIPPDSVKESRFKCIQKWMEYIEPGDELDNTVAVNKSNNNRNSRGFEDCEYVLPDNTLVRNLGMDIVVVVTKTDYVVSLEKENDYREEHFDFIQNHIRKFCLHYGAAVFYTSVKEDKNCDLLYKYLVHRIYGLPFKTPALIVEKDAVFIPAGWDNEKKMGILHENMTGIKPEDFYNDVILKPIAPRKPVSSREVEVEVEDEQKFLERQQLILQQTNKDNTTNRMQQSNTANKTNNTPTDTNKRLPSPLPGITPKKGDSTSSERVLANFFNSLLSKKTGGSPSNSNTNGTDC